MHPRYIEFLSFLESVQTDARINPNALNLAFDVWSKAMTELCGERWLETGSPFMTDQEQIQTLKKDLDRKHRECAEFQRQCALQAEYILELESLVENKADNDKTVKDYALWQAITDLEMVCRHRSAGQLQIESEDKQSTPIIENALILLKALKVDIEQNPKFPNIKINYDRDDNPFFGKSGK